MITNLNDEYTWVSWPKQVENRTCTLTMLEWLVAFENRLRSSTRGWLQEPEQEDFSQAKNRALGWSTAQDEIGRQPLQDDFKPPSCVKNLCIFIDYFLYKFLCKCQQESLNHTHSKERFSWKRLGALTHKQADISVPSWSYIKTRQLLSLKNS